MNVGIVEIMPTGHFTLVDSVTRIYLSDPANTVCLFTHSRGEVLAKSILEEFGARINLVLWDEQSLDDLAGKINKLNPDLVYFITLEKYYEVVLKVKNSTSIRLFIHNIEQWFGSGIFSMLKQFLRRMNFSRSDIYLFKHLFIFQARREKTANILLGSTSKFAVLSDAVKMELSKFVPLNRIEVIPFSVFNRKEMLMVNNAGTPMHITIPGMVDAVRRNYHDFFNVLQKHAGELKGKVIIELLGGIARKEGGLEIVRRAEAIQQLGIDIIFYNEDYIPLERFDDRLEKADFILGNMNVIIDPNVAYGRTKESGIQYTMVRAAKPGFLPAIYPVASELKSSTVLFDNYDHLIEIILHFCQNPLEIVNLKRNAAQNSRYFEPNEILKKLLN